MLACFARLASCGAVAFMHGNSTGRTKSHSRDLFSSKPSALGTSLRKRSGSIELPQEGLKIIRKLLIAEARLRTCIVQNRSSVYVVGVENAAYNRDAKQNGEGSKELKVVEPSPQSGQIVAHSWVS
jgi:hypothetical protein